MPKRFSLADLFCVTMTVVWGANLSFVKDALQEISPMSFNAVRLLLAALLLWLLTLVLEHRVELRKEDVLQVILLGLVGNTLYQVFFIYGIHFTKAGNVALLLCSGTILTALLSRFLKLEKLTRIVWLGIFVSLGGVFLILLESAELSIGAGSLRGDLAILGSSACWSAYTVYSKPLMSRYSSLSLTTLTLSVGALAFFVVSIPQLVEQNWAQVSPKSYAELTYSFVLAIGLGYAMWFYAIDRLGSTWTAIYGNLIPFTALLVARLFLGEPITRFQILGGVLIVTGIYLTRRGRPPDAPSALRRKQF